MSATPHTCPSCRTGLSPGAEVCGHCRMRLNYTPAQKAALCVAGLLSIAFVLVVGYPAACIQLAWLISTNWTHFPEMSHEVAYALWLLFVGLGGYVLHLNRR